MDPLRKLRPNLDHPDALVLTPGEIMTIAYVESNDATTDTTPESFLESELTHLQMKELCKIARIVCDRFGDEWEGFLVSYVTPERPVEVPESNDAMIPASFVRHFANKSSGEFEQSPKSGTEQGGGGQAATRSEST